MYITSEIDDDKPHEECGVFGVYGTLDASAHTALGLHALQHRGQESAGIVSFDGEQFYSHRAEGKVGDNFNSANVINALKGEIAIGHNRYATTGGTMLRNVQPLFAEYSFGGFAVAHNGNLTNAITLRTELKERGCLFQSTSDTETIIHLIAVSGKATVEERLVDALHQIKGAYSLVAVTADNHLIGVRDPSGVRPLVLGKLGDTYVLASESCALDIIGAELIRDVKAGEVVIINGNGITSLFPFEKTSSRFCIFEYVYFSRPDSKVEGVSVYDARKNIGAELVKEDVSDNINADIVVPVPDSGVPAAIGYAAAAGLPFELGIIRNHYVGRTFIEPTDQVRHLGVKLKHNANVEVLKGKKVILVDDSIVRGTTSKKIVQMVRDAGATEVHMRIASPPTIDSCYYGVDTPEKDKLFAANHSVKEMAKLINVDSLKFISVDGLYRAVGKQARDANCPAYCDACFTGDYPVELTT